MNVRKYFWWLNEAALRKTEKIIRNPKDPLFVPRLFEFLSRTDEARQLFSLISREQFVESWPHIRRHWNKRAVAPDFKAWWETIYEQLLTKGEPRRKPLGKPEKNLMGISRLIRNSRVQRGWSQSDFARRVGMRQPDISAIEGGKKNITVQTLIRLCQVLEIKTLNLGTFNLP